MIKPDDGGFMSDDLLPLLRAAQEATPCRSEGVLAAFADVVLGSQVFWGHTAEGWVVSSPLIAGVAVTTEFCCVQAPKNMPWASLQMLCANHLLDWEQEQIRGEQRKHFHCFGAGMRFTRTTSAEQFDIEEFLKVLGVYNCRRSAAERIAWDLMQTGERCTTVQSHLVAHWGQLEQDLWNIGVRVERALPRLFSGNSVGNLPEKFQSLRRQFGGK